MKRKWEAIRRCWPGKCKSNSIDEINGHKDNTRMATEINEFFCNVGANLAQDTPNPDPNIVEYFIQNTPISPSVLEWIA